jgi:hypothetical protein
MVPEGMYSAAGVARGNFYLFGGTTGAIHKDTGTFYRISGDVDPTVKYTWASLMAPPDDFSGSSLVALESYAGGYDTVILAFGGDVSRLEYYWTPFWNFVDGW